MEIKIISKEIKLSILIITPLEVLEDFILLINAFTIILTSAELKYETVRVDPLISQRQTFELYLTLRG